jgi:hypothetical protein
MQSLELMFENPDGGIFQYYPSTLSLRTERTCTPSILSGEIPDVSDKKPQMGATVRLKVDGVLMFLGRVFSSTVNRWGVFSFTAYDGLRYLKNTFSNYYHRDYSPKTVIEDIANLYGFKLGKIADVPNIGYALSVDNESCFDVISKLVDVSIVQTKRILVFYDNFGELTLSYADEMISDMMIGDDSLATEYTINTDIDNDTYNQVYLYRESGGTGGRRFVEAAGNDNANVQRWGQLCLIECVDDNIKNSQMQDRADKLLEMKNRPLKTMNISALGVVGLRAGMVITIHFPSLDDEVSKRQMVILDAVEHKFEDSVHTMELETRTFWRDS